MNEIKELSEGIGACNAGQISLLVSIFILIIATVLCFLSVISEGILGGIVLCVLIHEILLALCVFIKY